MSNASFAVKLAVTCAALCVCAMGAGATQAADNRAVFAFSGGQLVELDLAVGGGTTTLDAVAQGWWDHLGEHGASNPNYIAGFCAVCGNNAGQLLRDFFVFDLADVAPTVSAATLLIFNPSNGYLSVNPTENFELRDVVTPLADLIADGSGRVDIFEDLGTGSFFGQVVMSSLDNGSFVSISLNAAGVQAINDAAGDGIAFGGSVAGAVVPEPQMIGLLVGGLGLVAWRLRDTRRPQARRPIA